MSATPTVVARGRSLWPLPLPEPPREFSIAGPYPAPRVSPEVCHLCVHWSAGRGCCGNKGARFMVADGVQFCMDNELSDLKSALLKEKEDATKFQNGTLPPDDGATKT